MKSVNLVILAGGISSRMKKSIEESSAGTSSVLSDGMNKPKSMMRVGENERPFMDYLLYNAREAGFRNIVIVIQERDESVRRYYGTEFHGLALSYAVKHIPAGRTKPLGTADALLQALRTVPEWKGQTFVVCNSDNLYSVSVLEKLLSESSPCAMMDYDRDALRFEQSRIAQFAVIRKDAEGYLTDIIEKPSDTELQSARDTHGRVGVSMNIFKFEYDSILPLLEQVPLHPVRQEKELPRAVLMLIQKFPKAMKTIPVSETVPDLTSKDDIERVREFLKKMYPHFSWE